MWTTILAEGEPSPDHSAWWWALASIVQALFIGLGGIYLKIKMSRRTDSEMVVGQYEKLLEEHKTLLKEKDKRDARQGRKIDDLEKEIDVLRKEHREEMQKSWTEHDECLKREGRIRRRLDTHEKALREAGIDFDEYKDPEGS